MFITNAKLSGFVSKRRKPVSCSGPIFLLSGMPLATASDYRFVRLLFLHCSEWDYNLQAIVGTVREYTLVHRS